MILRMSKTNISLRAFSLILCCLCSAATADESQPSRAHYLANAGTVIEHGESRIAFDPLFRNDFGTYDLVPADIEAAFMAGAPPWDGIDAVFISHHHEDHFDPELILKLLNTQSGIELYAPAQATDALRAIVADTNDPVLDRIHGLVIEYGAPSIDIEMGTIFIEAIGIPHAGWPTRHKAVENIVFRVTLDDEATVMHFGDADPNDDHFAKNPDHWKKRHTHFAMPPFWFYVSDEGRQILEERINATHTIGVHVPTKMPYDPESRPDELQGVDLFRRQGGTRNITVTN
jgi:L-ascorbate metabolism protein UlaG (beta-lactamase superfamily)